MSENDAYVPDYVPEDVYEDAEADMYWDEERGGVVSRKQVAKAERASGVGRKTVSQLVRELREAGSRVEQDESGAWVLLDKTGKVWDRGYDPSTLAEMDLGLQRPIVKGLIYPGTAGIIAGVPKSGKTNLASALAWSLAEGRDFLGYEVPAPANVIFCEYEEGKQVIQGRLFRADADEGIDLPEGAGCLYLDHPVPLAVETDADGLPQVSLERGLGHLLVRWMASMPDEQRGRPFVLMFDTLARAVPGIGGSSYGEDVKAVSAVTEFCQAMLRDAGIDCAALFLHHTNKGQHADAQAQLSGTNGIAGSVSWDMTIYRDTDDEKARLPTGRIVGHSRMMADDEITRHVKLNGRGFWELDLEKETAEALKRRVKREKKVPPAIKRLVRHVQQVGKVRGTSSELMAEAGVRDVAANRLARLLAEHADYLAENGVVRETYRTSAARVQELTYVGGDAREALAPDLRDALEVVEDYYADEAAPVEPEPEPEQMELPDVAPEPEPLDRARRLPLRAGELTSVAALAARKKAAGQLEVESLKVERATGLFAQALAVYESSPRPERAAETVVSAATALAAMGVNVAYRIPDSVFEELARDVS